MVATLENLETTFISEQRFTQQQFACWLLSRPSHDINHYELIDGRIIMTPPAGWPHGKTESGVHALLHNYVKMKGLGITLGSSAGYDLPTGDTVEPDVSFISTERLKSGPEPEEGKFLQIVPNLIVEILSPSSKTRDLNDKKIVYESAGVEEYWIVDSTQREVTVFFSSEPGRFGEAHVFRSSDHLNSRAIPGFSCVVADLF